MGLLIIGLMILSCIAGYYLGDYIYNKIIANRKKNKKR